MLLLLVCASQRGVTVGAILNSLYFRVSSEGADKASIKEDAYNVLKNSEEFKSVNVSHS